MLTQQEKFKKYTRWGASQEIVFHGTNPMYFIILRTGNSEQSVAISKHYLENSHFSPRTDFYIPFLQQLSRKILNEVLEVNQSCRKQKDTEVCKEHAYFHKTNFNSSFRMVYLMVNLTVP